MAWQIGVLFVNILIVSLCANYLYIRFAKKFNIFDIPNSRSSHKSAIPRGSGIVFPMLALFLFLYIFYYFPANWLFYLVFYLTLLAISLIGFFDDLVGASISVRLMGQFVLSGLIITIVLVTNRVDINNIMFMALIFIVILFSFVWSINLLNFMDGLNGLASIGSISYLLFSCVLFLKKSQYDMAFLCSGLVAILLGYLFWNFPRAKVFMGDSGSYFIGFCLASIALIGYFKYQIDLEWWIVFHSVFIVDATLTLLKRIMRGDKWYVAHREHLFQLIHDKLRWSHRRIAAIYGLVIFIVSTSMFYIASLFDSSNELSAYCFAVLTLLSLCYLILCNKLDVKSKKYP